jgi:hypothetical protein
MIEKSLSLGGGGNMYTVYYVLPCPNRGVRKDNFDNFDNL